MPFFAECFAPVFVYVPYACIVNIYKKAAREEPLFVRVENESGALFFHLCIINKLTVTNIFWKD